MKSTRLPKKALRKIGTLTSVEYCLNNVLKLKNVDKVILATSTHPDDGVLAEHTFSDKIEFYRGDPEDVMQRIVDVVNLYNLDIVSRVTADMPFVPDEIYQMGLNSHFENGADYTQVLGAPIGLATSVMSANALIKAKELFPSAQYSEYLLYYFINNPKVFKINKYTVPKRFHKPYRLTLDYEEDLQLFNIIEENLQIASQTDSYIEKVYDFLNKNKEVASINQGLVVKYKSDQKLIDKINRYTTLKVK
jgi:spore coat polysaccharide biosynthesis protein SpsF (cytidylyltransferase family)